MPPFVVTSIQEIRERLTNDLQQLDHSSKVAPIIRDMQIACHDFLTYTQFNKRDFGVGSWDEEQKRFFIGLERLRHRIGIHIASLAVAMKIDVDDRLESILPGGMLFKE